MTNDRRRPSTVRARLGLGLLLVLGAVVAPAPAAAVATPPGDGAASTVTATNAPLTAEQLGRRLSSEVYGYLPYWEFDAGFDGYLQYDLLTDIALFSVGLTPAGAIETDAPGYRMITGSLIKTVIANAHAAGVRVDLTVTSFDLARNTAFFTNSGAMAAAVPAIASLVASLGLDGVNVDVEGLSGNQFEAYGAWVGQLRAALKATNPAARVSVATNGNLSGARMAAAAVRNNVDRVFIMGYNYRSAGSSPVGSIGPLARADGGLSLSTSVATYLAQGVRADRILLGLPYYGRTWPTASGELNAAATGSGDVFFPRSGMATIPPGTVINYDPVEHSAWFAVRNSSTGTWSQTYFDNERSLRAKYAYAAEQGLAGVGMWALGYDRGQPGYWQAIASSFGAIRLAGSDRYGTAAAASAHTIDPGVGTVYVATGLNFPDALAGAAVAGAANAPVILVAPTAIPAPAAAELARLKPARIVILGSSAVVSDGVAAALAAFAPTVERIGGADRYATAALVSAATYPGGAPAAYVVTGQLFPDAVSAAPAAARDGGPVLLAAATSLPEATRAELARLNPARVVIVGSVGALSADVEAAIRGTLPGAAVERIGGTDRYATSAALSSTFAPGAPAVVLATGTDFPDALAGGAAAGTLGGPLVLTAPTALPASVVAELDRLDPRRAIILGARSVVGDGVLAGARSLLAAS